MSKNERLNVKSIVDRFTATYFYFYFICFVMIIFSHELDLKFKIGLLLVLFLLPTLGLMFLIFASSIILNARRRHWRAAASASLAPLAAAAPLLLCFQLGVTPTWLHFQISRTAFERQIATMTTADGAPRLRAFEWDDTGGVAVANMFRTLVFDESDEISLPPDRRSGDWLERAKGQSGLYSIVQVQGSPTVQSMGRHWYVVTQVYQ